jgi:IS30 family transposase
MNKLTLEERKTIKKLVDKGYTLSECAKLIGRRKKTIVKEFGRFQGRIYDPVQAQKEADKRLVDKNKAVSKTLKEKDLSNPYKSLLVRIESLEMQIEILKDVIKEMKKC